MEINTGTNSNNKIIMIIIAIIILIIIGVVIFQKSNPSEEAATETTTTKPTDMKKTDTSSTTCLNPAASPAQGTSSGLLCSGGGVAYGGRNGVDGSDGSSGSNGSNGSSGSNGKDGTNGSNGSNGSDGANGGTGPQGPAGPAGPQGPAGPPGDSGDSGDDGDDGDGGDDGYYGAFAENTTPKTTTGHSPQSLDAEIWTDVSAEMSLSVDYATVVLTTGGSGIGDFLDGITGGTVYGDHIWTVVCSNSTGYELALKEKAGVSQAGALVHTADSGFKFDAMNAGTPEATFPTPAAGATAFGYSITAHTSTLATGWTTGWWNGVTTSDVKLLDKTSASAEAGDTMNLRWQARFTTGGGQYLKTGTYKEFVTLTASTQ